MRALPVLLLLLSAAPAAAQLRLPVLLSDGAVLQRGAPVPVWGWAAPGDAVTVRLGGSRVTAVAGTDGRWRVEAPALPAGGPYALDVRTARERVRAENLLVGDVWVLSGQSNMQWPVQDALGGAAAVAAAGDDRIRHLRVPHAASDAPRDDLPGGVWEPATPANVGGFSAVGYFFARDLRAHVDVPIGLVHASWGGSRIEPWMSAAMLGLDAAGVAAARVRIDADRRALADALRERLGGAFPSGAPEPDSSVTPAFGRADLDDSGWTRIRVPVRWESAGYDGLDGVAWYRTAFDASPDDVARGVTLSLGLVDDADHTYVNGALVGQGRGGSIPRAYRIPPGVLRSGPNVLAVRVSDSGGSGGLKGGEGLLFVEHAGGERQPLAGDWRFRVVDARVSAPEPTQVPMGLWNQMVRPLTEAPVAGVLWYQGESNANEAEAYRAQFQALITGWRAAWGRPALPFLWVQLAGYRQPPEGPDDAGSWPALRAAQSAALTLPRTAEALALDVGNADDIHPRDKRTVGRRLALAARAVAYDEAGVTYSGPRYRSHRVRDGRVEIAFDHAGAGLATRAGAPLGGFAVAGTDGVWHWADARTEGDRVAVWSPAVPAPTAVRYAWADHPTTATLTNAEGLPAAPFSTRAP